MLQWMSAEATNQTGCRAGGIIFDEMAIQQDLEMEECCESLEFRGLVETGPECAAMPHLQSYDKCIRMASHILQFIFLGYDGFRFPFAFYPTAGVTAPELNILFWRAIQMLELFHFCVDYTCMDGASCNRSFMNTLLQSESNETFAVDNLFCSQKKIHNVDGLFPCGEKDKKQYFLQWNCRKMY
jgi:hypothetical protein